MNKRNHEPDRNGKRRRQTPDDLMRQIGAFDAPTRAIHPDFDFGGADSFVPTPKAIKTVIRMTESKEPDAVITIPAKEYMELVEVRAVLNLLVRGSGHDVFSTYSLESLFKMLYADTYGDDSDSGDSKEPGDGGDAPAETA